MAVVNKIKFVVSKQRIANGEIDVLYTCPQERSHAIVDITKRYINGNSTTGDKATINYYAVKDVLDIGFPEKRKALFLGAQVDNEFIYPELNKVIIGGGWSLVAEVVTGDVVNFRVTGNEYSDDFVKDAGMLNSVKAKKADTMYEVFRLDDLMAAKAVGTISMFNFDEKTSSMTDIWISDTDKPAPVDLIMLGNVPPSSSAFIENVAIAPGERIFVSSIVKDMVISFVGVTISSMIGTCNKDPKPGEDDTNPKP